MLDDLVATIETLKARILKHRADLQANETRTRVALIDPLLTVLGWDTSDPGLVTLEYDVSGKRADYALLNGQATPVVFLEAKKLEENLSNHRSQVVAYASDLGIQYPALTNGNDWEVYDNSKLVPIQQRRILNVSITEELAHQTALKLLLLWRPNLESGQPVAASEPLLVSASHPEPSTTETAVNPETNVLPTPAASYQDGWVSLPNFQAGIATKPPSIRLPDGTEKQLSYWYQVLVETAEWLIRASLLTVEKCPIRNNGKVSIVHTEPRHESGNAFFHPHTLSTGLFLNKHGNRETVLKYTEFLLKPFETDPASVLLKLN